ncbi:hypothetical protein FNF31_01169 [Cafeteria roenbergensis]|uniref:Uncharacterized protein n=1 Tax=Cafeteria roenbergensis TaxID=33653 RepID=A0A5A8DPY0_CAFRO|nr:hypothetical protein FNF31_01169 [Cafeteria roenbergensis]
MAAPKFCGRDRLSAAEFAASSVEAILALAKVGIAIVSPFYEGFADSGVPDRAAWLSASSCVPVYPEEPCQGLSCSASKWEKAKVVACDVALALGHNAAARLALVTGESTMGIARTSWDVTSPPFALRALRVAASNR